jgi:alkanesulfonate monooxygenase SsuD/methylene tetrahydromethanopterin reductase-like flavin-dependent oxidoreductase (luciferase family)
VFSTSVGIQLPEVGWEVPFPELIAMAQTAEAVGFDSIWRGTTCSLTSSSGCVTLGECGWQIFATRLMIKCQNR